MFFPEVPEGLLPFFDKDGLPSVGLRTTQSLLTIPSPRSGPPPRAPRHESNPPWKEGKPRAVSCWSWSLGLSKSESCQLHMADALPVEASLVQLYTTERLN